MNWVAWRLDGAEFFQENQPDFVIVLQVPKETQTVKVSAALQAYRYFNFASAGVRAAVKQLSSKLKGYFEGGLPVRDETNPPWDLTPVL